MVAQSHLCFLVEHIPESFLVFGFETRILFGFCVTMYVFITSLPQSNGGLGFQIVELLGLYLSSSLSVRLSDLCFKSLSSFKVATLFLFVE